MPADQAHSTTTGTCQQKQKAQHVDLTPRFVWGCQVEAYDNSNQIYSDSFHMKAETHFQDALRRCALVADCILRDEK